MAKYQPKQRVLPHKGWQYYLLLVVALTCGSAANVSATPARFASDVLLVTQFKAHHLVYVDPEKGIIARVKVGRAPYSVAVSNDQAYVATAEGLAIVDLHARERSALIPYQAELSGARWGEYRQGGMGVAVSLDGKTVAVGINRGRGAGQLEVISTESHTVTASVAIGVRPFQVLFSQEGDEIYSIDHDSYSVTAFNLKTRSLRVFDVAPLGYGGFAKPHYAAISLHGDILLPIQGRILVQLNPKTGEQKHIPLSARTHQHGVALNKNDSTLFVVGTGPAGDVTGAPVLSRINLRDGQEAHIPLQREHEQIALSGDGKMAYLTGGHSFTEGWNGISVVNFSGNEVHTMKIDGQPLGIALWSIGDNKFN